MKCMLIRSEKGLHGATPDDHEKWLKFKRRLETIKPGRWLRMEWSTPRNGPQHRKLFALLNLVTENSEVYDTVEKALVAVKLCVGYFDVGLDPTTGEMTKQVKSIAFESMEQDDFDAFYAQAIDGVLQHILPQMDRATADKLLDMIVSGWVAR